MQILTIANQKGGVAKTTTAFALGVGLSKRGNTVLLFDLDPQTNLTFTAGIDFTEGTKTIYDVFKGENINNAIQSVSEGLDIVPGSIYLAAADRQFIGAKSFYMVRDAIQKINKIYNYVIIDTPPTLGVMTQNALTASNRVIIPLKPDVYALQGIGQLNAFIDEQKNYTNPNLQIAGCLVTCANERTTLAKTMIEEFEKTAAELNTKVYKSKIRNAVSVAESALQQTNIFSYAPAATATKDYDAFIDELLTDLGKGE